MKRLVYLYAPEDEGFLLSLIAHLAPLEKQGLIRGWHRGHILPSQSISETLRRKLEKADLILLLVSSDLLLSHDAEVQLALSRQQARTALVVPIRVRPFSLNGLPLADLQALPTGDKSINQWGAEPYDAAWQDVTAGIRLLVTGSATGDAPSNAQREVRPRSAPREDVLGEYLSLFVANDPKNAPRDDVQGYRKPFVELRWMVCAPEDVKYDLRRDRPSRWPSWLRRRRVVRPNASQSLVAVLCQRPPAPELESARYRPWLVHVDAGGGKTTSIQRALGEVAEHARQELRERQRHPNPGPRLLEETPLPVYVRLAGVGSATLKEFVASDKGSEALRRFIVQLSRDTEQLQHIERDCPCRLAVVIDGLDEVPWLSLREQLYAWILDGASAFCARNSLVITCRTLDVPGLGEPPSSNRPRRNAPLIGYLHLLPIDEIWQETWCRQYCEADAAAATWLIEQITRLRQLRDTSSIDDPRTGRSNFLRTAFFFTGLARWLFKQHRRDPMWVPEFPANTTALLRVLVRQNLEDAVDYLSEGHDAAEADGRIWADRTAQVERFLSVLAYERLSNPDDGWDIPEATVLERLDAWLVLEAVDDRDWSQLLLDKSRLLVRVGGGQQRSVRGFAHPLIVEHLAAQHLSHLVAEGKDANAGETLVRATEVAWTARCFPGAAELLDGRPMPAGVIENLLRRSQSTPIESNLDGLTASEAKLILLDILNRAAQTGVLRQLRPQLVTGLINLVQLQANKVPERSLNAVIAAIRGWLEQAPSKELLEYTAHLTGFASFLRACSWHPPLARALAQLFEGILSAGGLAPSATPQFMSVYHKACEGQVLNSRWPLHGSSPKWVMRLREIEQATRDTILRALLRGLKIFLVVLAALGGLVGLGILLVYFLKLPSRYIYSHLPSWVPDVFWGIGIVLIAGIFLFGIVLGPGWVIHNLIGLIPTRLRRSFHASQVPRLTQQVRAAVLEDGIALRDAQKWIENYARHPLLDHEDAQCRLALLQELHKKRLQRPNVGKRDPVPLALGAAADQVRSQFQQLRYEELHGLRGKRVVDKRPFIEERSAEETFARDCQRLRRIDAVSLLVVGLIGLAVLCYQWVGLESQRAAVALAALVALPLLCWHLLRHSACWSPTVGVRRGWDVATALISSLSALAIVLGVTAIALKSQAQIVNSPACLTTSLWYLARERLPYIVAFTLGAVSFFNLLLVILHSALARSLLEIPRAKRLQQIERWFCGVLFGIVCIATAVSVSKAGLRCDPAPVLAVHAAQIRAGDYPSSVLSEALEPLAVELRRAAKETPHSGAQFQRAMQVYLCALRDRAKEQPSTVLSSALYEKAGILDLIESAANEEMLTEELLATLDDLEKTACRSILSECVSLHSTLARVYERLAQPRRAADSWLRAARDEKYGQALQALNRGEIKQEYALLRDLLEQERDNLALMAEQANATLLLGLSKEALKLAQDTEQHPRVSPPNKAVMVLYQAIDNSLLGQTRAALLQADRAARLFSELKEPLARSWSFPRGDLVEKSFAERRAVRELLIALKKSEDEPSTQLKTAARLVREFAATLEKGCNADLAESEIE